MAKKKTVVQIEEIRGIKQVTEKMDQVAADLSGSPMVEGMRDATLLITRGARILSPVDTGRLRASIAPEVVPAGRKVQGVVGSNVVYAPYQELGTSRIRPKRFLEGAFRDNYDKIVSLVGNVVAKIVRK